MLQLLEAKIDDISTALHFFLCLHQQMLLLSHLPFLEKELVQYFSMVYSVMELKTG